MVACARTSTNLANLARDLPSFMFAPSCPPSAIAPSCLPIGDTCCTASKLFWTIVVPWEKFLSEGWKAPGGNRYWARNITPSANDPVAVSVLRLMAARSKEHFQNTFLKSDYKNRKMKDVLQQYAGKLATSFGIVSITIQPNPEETAEAFVRRGGFLLWIDPASGPFRDKHVLQSYWAEWLTRDVVHAQLWGNYVPEQNVLGYSIRLEYKGGIDKVVQDVSSKVRSYATKFCEKATSAEAATAVGVVAAIAGPASAPYVGAWSAAAAVCNWPAGEPCTPLPPNPVDDSKVIRFTPAINIAGGGKSSFSVPGAFLFPTMTVTTTAPTNVFTPPPSVIQPLPSVWYQRPTTAKAAAGIGIAALIGGLAISLFGSK